MIVLYVVALYFSKQFLDGVKQVDCKLKLELQEIIIIETFQRDHKKMQFYVYVNIALAGLATLGILFVTVIILFDLRTLQTDKTVDRTALAEIFLLVLALFVGFQFYCLVCINSLFLRIKEENLNTLPSGRASNNNAVFMNQQKPAMPNQQGGFDQPPPYPAEQTSQFAMQK